jgi:flagellar basal-body rod protein FlgB
VDSKKLFGGTISMLGKLLDLRSLNHHLIVSNIANKDTPNFKAFNMVIEEELGKLIENEKAVDLKRTHNDHFPSNDSRLTKVILDRVKINPALLKGDGNTVDIDKAMGDLSENNLMYTISAQILSKKFESLKNTIQGGNK